MYRFSVNRTNSPANSIIVSCSVFVKLLFIIWVDFSRLKRAQVSLI